MNRRWAVILWVVVSVQMCGLAYAVVKLGNVASQGQHARGVQCGLAPVSQKLYERAGREGWLAPGDIEKYRRFRARC